MKITELKPGDLIIADGGFSCLKENAMLEVKTGLLSGHLYVNCDCGKHFLDALMDMFEGSGLKSEAEVIGFRRADPQEDFHPNGKPKWSSEGMLLDETGERSIFDDIAE